MTLFGCFGFTRDPLTIRHLGTNQSVSLRHWGAPDREGWSCEYRHGAGGSPILFDIEVDSKRPTSFPRLCLDYRNAFATPPAFTEWKRMDDFLVDALTCWPQFVFGHRSQRYLRVEGGWCNAVWAPGLSRLFSSGKSKDFLDRAQASASEDWSGVPKESIREWEYVDCELPERQASFVHTCSAPSFLPFLGREERVAGFQGKVPYLATKDRRAYIAPLRFWEATERDDCLHPHATYVYINDDFFYQFKVHDASVILLRFVRHFGFRDRDIDRRYWPLALSTGWKPVSPTIVGYPGDVSSETYGLPYRLWQEGFDAIANAWSAWRRPPRKVAGLNDVHVGFDRGRASMSFQGGYSAGISNDAFRVEYTYPGLVGADNS